MSVANPFLFWPCFLQCLIYDRYLYKNSPQRIERKRDSIEFERSENIGQFFMIWAFNYFLMFLMLLDTVKCLWIKAFRAYTWTFIWWYMDVYLVIHGRLSGDTWTFIWYIWTNVIKSRYWSRHNLEHKFKLLFYIVFILKSLYSIYWLNIIYILF